MVFPSSRGRGGAQWVDVAACDEGVGRCDRPVCCGVTGGFGAVYRRLSAVAILVAQSRVVSGRSRRGLGGRELVGLRLCCCGDRQVTISSRVDEICCIRAQTGVSGLFCAILNAL